MIGVAVLLHDKELRVSQRKNTLGKIFRDEYLSTCELTDMRMKDYVIE